MTADEKSKIVNMALRSLGVLKPGETPSACDFYYVRYELDAILATLHWILAQRCAVQYKMPPPANFASPIIATENAPAPQAGDKCG